jgi:hypothetical protein
MLKTRFRHYRIAVIKEVFNLLMHFSLIRLRIEIARGASRRKPGKLRLDIRVRSHQTHSTP